MPNLAPTLTIVEATAASVQGQLFRPTLKLTESPSTVRVASFGAQCSDCNHANHTKEADGTRGKCSTFGCSCASHAALAEKIKEAHHVPLTLHPRLIESSYDPTTRTATVVIIEEGVGNARDMHYYGKSTIVQAVADKVFDGAQAYADHPGLDEDVNRPERSVRDLFGYYFDTKVIESHGKTAMSAKLKIQDGAEWAVGLIKEAIDYNKRFPDKAYVGISINADGDVAPDTQNGEQVNHVKRITQAFSADMVTKPARGGRFLALVESASGAQHTKKENKSVTIAQLRESAARLTEAITSGKTDIDKDQLTAVLGGFSLLKESDMKGMNTSGLSSLTPTDGDNELAESAAFAEAMSPEDKAAMDKLDEADRPAFLKGKMGEAAATRAFDVQEAAKEAAARGKGSLVEADVAKAYPSLYAAALREAQTSVGEDVAKLRSENASLRAEKNLRESIDTARNKVTKANLPAAASRRLIETLVGKTPVEMDRLIETEIAYTRELGFENGRRIEGAGESVTIRESDTRTNANTLLSGVGSR